MRLKRFVYPLLLLWLPAAAAAQPEPRTIEASAGTDWSHAETGMVLPAEAAGLTRASIRDLGGTGELDVATTYVNRDDGVIALVYVYRTMTPDVALWFDRALAPIVLQRPEQTPPAIAGFTRPGASVASGLRAALEDNVPGMRSTAIAIAPHGPWLVKVRLGSSRLDPAELDERLSAFVAALGWPAETANARPAVAVEPCATPLRFRRARIVRTAIEDMLIDTVAGSVSAEGESGPPPVYCREPGATLEWSVYRPNGATNRYLIAVGDAGIAIEVGEALDLAALLGDGRGRRRFSTTMLERNAATSYPSFDRLPPPDQALDLVRTASPSMSTTVGD